MTLSFKVRRSKNNLIFLTYRFGNSLSLLHIWNMQITLHALPNVEKCLSLESLSSLILKLFILSTSAKFSVLSMQPTSIKGTWNS